MALDFYQNYLYALAPENADDAYRDLIQATICDQWDNTTQVITVCEQCHVGHDCYEDIEVRVDYAIDMGTGLKKGDDFKIFAFKDITHKEPKGLMYQYDDDYWLVTNTSELGSATSEVTVRRCNNVMRWVDRENGYLYEYPCIIEYVLESSQQLKDKDVITANGHIPVMCQGDDITRNLEKNTRFIFNKQPFKLVAYQNMLNEGVTDNMASDLLYLDMRLDMEEPDDDIENNIANKFSYDYTLELTAVPEQKTGFIGKVIPVVKLNGEIVDREVVFTCCRNAEVQDDGTFTLTGEAGEKAIIWGNIVGNKQLVAEVVINIVDEFDDTYELIIDQEFNSLRIGKSKTFSVTLYKNGEAQEDVVDYTTTRLSDEYFNLVQDGNTFTLTALQISTTPLEIVFSAGQVSTTMDIMFTSVF